MASAEPKTPTKGDGSAIPESEDGPAPDDSPTQVKAPKLAIVTQEKHDSPKADPPEADEFGLPVRPPRRRGPTLDELESPEEIRQKIMEKALEGRESTEPSKVSKGKEAAVEGVDESVAGEAASAPAESSGDKDVKPPETTHSRNSSAQIPHDQAIGATSEWSHQQLAPHADAEEDVSDHGEWQEMPALAEHRIYDDWGKVLAKGYDEVDDDKLAYGARGGAGKGYTRVQVDEDAQSATSLDDNTAYLFKDQYARNTLDEEDEEGRDLMSQMQTTKELLTEAQRIAYVGVVRLSINEMAVAIEKFEKNKNTKKVVELVLEAVRMWGQKIMVQLYRHMDIAANEQVMVEQLADHGVLPSDLTPCLMQNARVKNPQAQSETSSKPSSARPSIASPRPSSAMEKTASSSNLAAPRTPAPSVPGSPDLSEDVPPPYEEHTADELAYQDPDTLTGKDIDLDIRWTVLCDLFLLLIADSTYDARSRTLLQLVGGALSVEWQEIGRFEKRVTDALEMQEQADKENWNEEEHLQARKKAARNKRLMVMGLCTVGGGLVIGLSAGMLAPVIGAGLAAGFTGIGVAGTSTFLTGTGAAALIGTTGTLIGSSIGMKTSERRTGAVKDFEYKPLFNNKRVNLVVTISGWMTGNVDDVRLPFSTVDPIMGDIYSVSWEPDMLRSTGQTIQILGTEALTQTIQQILGATFLATLMAGLSLPIVLTKLSYLIDNPWTVSLARADATGLILADSLIDRNLGVRPITLVGFSLGSRVIFSCLRELARRGAVGLIENVYMFGSPVVVKKDEWTRARAMVSGRFVNGYATNDWILAYLFRATSGGIMRVAGLATVDIPGTESIDVTADVPGHMAYRGKMPKLLQSVGWAVESLKFTEIEDPDPENHAKRQRELLNEIEEARREMEEKQQTEKKGFKAFFSRRKAPQKKDWETYDDRSQKVLEGSDVTESERVAAENTTVMFDVDAIRKEALQLALEGGNIDEIKAHLQIREIESTMPALRIETPKKEEVKQAGSSTPNGIDLKRSQTHDGSSSKASSAQPDKLPNGHGTSPTPQISNEEDIDDSNITLSFESPQKSGINRRPSPSPSPRFENTEEWPSMPVAPTPQPERPILRTANTMPAGAASHQSSLTAGPAASTDHNPWAEDKEVEMSFE